MDVDVTTTNENNLSLDSSVESHDEDRHVLLSHSSSSEDPPGDDVEHTQGSNSSTVPPLSCAPNNTEQLNNNNNNNNNNSDHVETHERFSPVSTEKRDDGEDDDGEPAVKRRMIKSSSESSSSLVETSSKPSSSSTRAPPPGHATMDMWVAEARKIVVQMMEKKYAIAFHEPVNPERDGVPTYFEVIQQPMDLGTILKKLEKRSYSHPSELQSDVELVWSNCSQFNGIDHPLYTLCAVPLSKFFKERYRRIIERYERGVEKYQTQRKKAAEELGGTISADELSSIAARAIKSESSHEATSKDLSGSRSKAQHQPSTPSSHLNSKSNKAVDADIASIAPISPSTPGSSYKSKSNEMPFLEKRKLAFAIEKLPPEEQMIILEILARRIGVDWESDEVVIELDKVDVKTLRCIELIVMDYISRARKRKTPNPKSSSSPSGSTPSKKSSASSSVKSPPSTSLKVESPLSKSVSDPESSVEVSNSNISDSRPLQEPLASSSTPATVPSQPPPIESSFGSISPP